MNQNRRSRTKNKTKKLNKDETRVATWNLQGKLESKLQQEILGKDMLERKIHIACLQDTRWNSDAEVTINEEKIINFAGKADNKYKRYGMGFFISNAWLPRLVRA